MTARDERLLELLCDRSVGELTAAEEAEFRSLLEAAGPRGESEQWAIERAAAAIAVAGASPAREPLPSRLAARLEQEALANSSPGEMVRRGEVIAMPHVRRWPVVLAWTSAAACLLLALAAWIVRPAEVVVTKEVVVSTPPPAPPPPSTPEAERNRLLAREGTAKLDWTRSKEPAAVGATGDVVWNQIEQRGYLRFHGLAKNDKTVSQYQLWIFDKSRDERYPVDGGVFDVADGSGDVVVPIRARLPVGDPVLFAVTVEQPGGVVVSKREHIVLTAKTHA